MVCRLVVNVESEDYLGMQINRSTRKKFVRQRGVCALGCSFGAMLCPGEGWLVGVEAGEGPGLCCGSFSGESAGREALSILLPHTQGASGTATAGMMLIFGALL